MVKQLDDDKDGKITVTVRVRASRREAQHAVCSGCAGACRCAFVPVQDLKLKWNKLMNFLGYGMPSGACVEGVFVVVRPSCRQSDACRRIVVDAVDMAGVAFAGGFVLGLSF